MGRVYDWAEIQRYYDAGHGFVACTKQFGCSHTAVVKAIGRGELRAQPAPFADRRRKYDWAAVQRYYDAGHTYRDCQAAFGFGPNSWTKAIRRGELRAKAQRKPLNQMLATSPSRWAIRARLLRDGIFTNRCGICGLTEWQGRELSMHLDHINGINDDNRLQNLRMLCPNCHSQTGTYGARNIGRKRLQESPPIV